MQKNGNSKLTQSSKEYAEIQKFLSKANDPIVEKIRRYLNELQIHRIELHSQNEELRSTQEELQELKDEYFELYNSAPIGYVVLDKNAIIKKCNIRFQNYLGYVAFDIINKPFNKFLKESNDFLSMYSSFFKRPQNKIFEYEFIGAEGKTFYGRIIGSIMHNSVLGSTETSKLFLVVNDISKQKFYEEQNEILLKNKSKFISTIAHDIRNPLSSILGYAQFLKTEQNNLNNEEISNYLLELNNIGKHLYSFINNFLDLSKVNFDFENIELTAYNQNEIITEVIEGVKSLAEHKNIDIVFESKEEKLNCCTNKFMVSTVFRNILTNAIKFSNKNSKVKISTDKVGKYGVIKFEDNGVGISEEKLEELLNTNNPTSTKGTDNEIGSGLGLLICKEYVPWMKGKLDIKSKLNEGTTITVSLLLD